jgi:hypothetical protein
MCCSFNLPPPLLLHNYLGKNTMVHAEEGCNTNASNSLHALREWFKTKDWIFIWTATRRRPIFFCLTKVNYCSYLYTRGCGSGLFRSISRFSWTQFDYYHHHGCDYCIIQIVCIRHYPCYGSSCQWYESRRAKWTREGGRNSLLLISEALRETSKSRIMGVIVLVAYQPEVH